MANSVNVGLGTKIANGLKAVGIKPCKGCSKRVDYINNKEKKAKVIIKKIFK